MLFRTNQMPPVLTNNSAMIGQPMNQNSNTTINPMGMANHFPVSQDVDLRSMGKLINQSQFEFRVRLKFIHFFIFPKI